MQSADETKLSSSFDLENIEEDSNIDPDEFVLNFGEPG